MSESLSFWEAFFLWKQPMAAAIVAAALCGYLGVFVVLRRIAFVSSALSQISGLGVALSFWVGSFFGLNPHEAHLPLWLHPLAFALLFAACGSTLLGLPGRTRRLSPESVVALGYLASGALVILVLSSPRIAQEAHEVGDLLFGATVAVQREHLTSLCVTALLVAGLHAALFKDFIFVSFDPTSARAMGYPVQRLEMLLHLSLGLSVAVATRAIGALPVFGFLVLPAAAALLHCKRLGPVLLLATLVAVVAAALGFYLSFVWRLPTGPTMVAVLTLSWLGALPGWLKTSCTRSSR